jgi:hypothetical protein
MRGAVKRTIAGQAANRRMTLGDLRQFIASIENVPDEAYVKAGSPSAATSGP